VINLFPDLWRIDPSTLPAFDPAGRQGRRIHGGPLVDRIKLQALLRTAKVDLDDLVVGTDSCDRDLRNNRWTNEHVLQMLNCLLAVDYRKSEWCQVRGGQNLPSDVYVLPFDNVRQQRRQGGLDVYLKFSLGTDGTLTIVLVSCHSTR
jgi:hypothetical protein